jgi:hypothetical protein
MLQHFLSRDYCLTPCLLSLSHRGRWEHIAVPSSFMLGVVADVVEAMAMLHEAGIAHG